ncbi:unnamed protein product, partial [Nesidiocoris tenuis]
MPPETRWRHHMPDVISASVKSSGMFISSPMSRYWKSKTELSKKNCKKHSSIWNFAKHS